MVEVQHIVFMGGGKPMYERPKLYTMDMAAQALGIAKSLLKRHVNEGRIQYLDLAAGGKYRKIRFTDAHLAAFWETVEQGGEKS